ncbi:hypothetical protein MTF64_01945 [Pseudoalteromonas sp. 2CM41L]|uniref:hypothetical protein n=1 Tax=Pseudoalteromonas sp. 2CM41L TaxID=2929857 RepID=UPI0020BE4CA2|nr:hypothetical protein [Pseudoalteromonas sp. 2CM41L]MCK8105655.1 hypothetical protein [Pseudoalteromonas sp. 2CM41L]
MEQLPNSAYIAIGAICAAIIAAIMSLLSLVISKEQKVSEFRQEWINSMRQDISELIGLFTTFKSNWLYQMHSGEDPKEFIKNNSSKLGEIDNIATRIILHLNPNEHEEFKALVLEFDSICSSAKKLSDSKITEKAHRDLVNESQKMLKSEWQRVKDGESGFKVAKKALSSFLAITFIISISALIVA